MAAVYKKDVTRNCSITPSMGSAYGVYLYLSLPDKFKINLRTLLDRGLKLTECGKAPVFYYGTDNKYQVTLFDKDVFLTVKEMEPVSLYEPTLGDKVEQISSPYYDGNTSFMTGVVVGIRTGRKTVLLFNPDGDGHDGHGDSLLVEGKPVPGYPLGHWYVSTDRLKKVEC